MNADRTQSQPGTWSAPDPLLALFRRRRAKQRRRLLIQVLLFVTTVVTTTAIGGLSYSIPLLAILLFHEMGHYFAARHYRVAATLPYFIPAPTIFGTFGAVIRMSGIIPHRKALFDIGIMGPLAGVVVAIPVTLVGLQLSTIGSIESLSDGGFRFGDSLMIKMFVYFIHGRLEEGRELLLHPLGFAGWVGLFVTALNLTPIGQLDGGHVIYALFPRRSRAIYRYTFALIVLLTFLYSPGFTLFLILIYFLVRLQHPPTLNDEEPIGWARFMYGILALLFFVLTIPPQPIQVIQPVP